MRIREVFCKRWLLKKEVEAVTIYPFIFYRGIPTAEVRRHELVHINQIQKIGWLKFYITYLWYSVKLGYRNNPYEKEAREK